MYGKHDIESAHFEADSKPSKFILYTFKRLMLIYIQNTSRSWEIFHAGWIWWKWKTFSSILTLNVVYQPSWETSSKLYSKAEAVTNKQLSLSPSHPY